jgi:exonuclease III
MKRIDLEIRGGDLMGPCVCQSESIRWRIDYQIATPEIAAKAVSAVVERAATHDERWSDHAPVTVTFDV